MRMFTSSIFVIVAISLSSVVLVNGLRTSRSFDMSLFKRKPTPTPTRNVASRGENQLRIPESASFEASKTNDKVNTKSAYMKASPNLGWKNDNDPNETGDSRYEEAAVNDNREFSLSRGEKINAKVVRFGNLGMSLLDPISGQGGLILQQEIDFLKQSSDFDPKMGDFVTAYVQSVSNDRSDDSFIKSRLSCNPFNIVNYSFHLSNQHHFIYCLLDSTGRQA